MTQPRLQSPRRCHFLFSPLCEFFIALCAQADNHAFGHRTQSKSYSMFLCCVLFILLTRIFQLVQARALAKAKPKVPKATARMHTEKRKALAKAGPPRATHICHEAMRKLPIAIPPLRKSHN